MIAAVLLALLALLTASCGDLQDPATGTTIPVTYLDGPPAHHPSPSLSVQAPEPASTDSMPSSGAQGTGQAATGQSQGQQTTQEGTKSVTLGWDPSLSQDVLGYKVYFVEVSTSVQQIIDVGSKTEFALPLRIGERYGFTVTAYNSSFESQALPYLLFQVW